MLGSVVCVKESRTLIVVELNPVCLVHSKQPCVHRFPQAWELQWLRLVVKHPLIHYQKYNNIILLIIIVT